MASFIPWYGKKHLRLAKLEREFVLALQSEASKTQLAEAAETIRAAQIRALKESRQKFAPSEKNALALDRIEQRIRRWMDLSTDTIIDGYRDPKRRGKLLSVMRGSKTSQRGS